MPPPPDQSARAARRFGLLSLPAGLGAAALVLWLRTGSAAAALLPALAALLSVALAWRAPAALGPVHRLAARVGAAAARLLAWLLLAAVYFTAFTAASLVARVLGYDAMRRRFDPRAPSYWEPRRPAPESLERWFDPH